MRRHQLRWHLHRILFHWLHLPHGNRNCFFGIDPEADKEWLNEDERKLRELPMPN